MPFVRAGRLLPMRFRCVLDGLFAAEDDGVILLAFLPGSVPPSWSGGEALLGVLICGWGVE